LNVGAVFDSLRCADVPKFELPIPRLDEQRAIAHILGTLDAKIELNRRMAETLTAMALTLFDEWMANLRAPRATVAELVAEGVLEIGDGYRAKGSELGAPGLPFIRAGDIKGDFQTETAAVLNERSVGKAESKTSRQDDVR
jgi:restriction endonuclease S subunit